MAGQQGLCVSELLVLRVDKKSVLPNFLTYHLLTKHIIDLIDSSTFGAKMPRADWAFIGRLELALPPLDEQQAIVDYLNHKIDRINSFINNKLLLIALLQEQKTALINRAVTRGIHLGVKLEPSGIKWLGDIPKHWSIRRNGALFTQRDQRGVPDLPILMVSLRTGVTVDELQSDRPKRLIEDKSLYKKAVKGDIAYNKMRMWQGAVGVVPADGLVSPDYTVATALEGVDARYYSYLFRTDMYKIEINRHSHGIVSDRNRLYWIEFKQMMSPLPPLNEQREIVSFIERESRKIDQAIAKAQREIELIKEFRTTLISDCVTGKIDVRQVTAEVLPFSPKNPVSPSIRPEFKRALLAAEIIYLQHQDPTFGRVKFQKTLHLCEYQMQIDELGSDYKREAAGPHDSRMLYQIESQLKRSKWFQCVGTRNEQHRYIPLEKVESYKKYFERHWGERHDAIHSIINLLKPLDSERCEIVSTLYAAWNDLLLTKQTASDEAIIQEVLNWHESKLRIPEERWRRALQWMRSHGLVPAGFGKPTHRLVRKPSSKSKV